MQPLVVTARPQKWSIEDIISQRKSFVAALGAAILAKRRTYLKASRSGCASQRPVRCS
jgi:hypothetical protein